MKKIFAAVCSFLFISEVVAQNYYEGLRYSQTFAGGTARGLGAGSAFGALGADFTSVGINPGGLGLYRSSEATFSLNLNGTSSTSNFGGSGGDQLKLNFHVPNFGVVINKMFVDKRGNRSKGNWIGVNFAFGMTRHANFNSKRFYNNPNGESILPYWASDLNGINPNNVDFGAASFEAVLAYYAFLTDPDENDPTGLTYVARTEGFAVNKQVAVNTSGKIDEMTFSFAANHNDKIYFGATMGMPIVNYEEELIYREGERSSDSIPYFNNFEMVKNMRTNGAGINLKVGAVYRAQDWLRLGLAFHTPSYMGLRDRYYSNIYSNVDTATYDLFSPDGSFKYKVLSPFRAVASAGFIIKKYGFISVDYDFANYAGVRYSMENQYQLFESNLNTSIDNALGISHTIRAGAEAAIKDFRLRAGYNISTNPLNTSVRINDENKTFQSFSGGMGYRGEKINLDFAYVRSIIDDSVFLGKDIVSIDRITRNNFIVTFGLRF